ncbi:hypothetical protein Plec18167_009251 [Paecilomyces lecythidis]|uniref:Uncharacterized protein n=1 Tax=Paecilomyces lecythidis TaxID=3004212 RepID=A0ABR3WQL4_9EURO
MASLDTAAETARRDTLNVTNCIQSVETVSNLVNDVISGQITIVALPKGIPKTLWPLNGHLKCSMRATNGRYLGHRQFR